jgi:CBS domain-containing protein
MKTIETFVKPIITASPSESLTAVARLMDEHNVGAVVIAEDHRPVGIVTDRDLAVGVLARGRSGESSVAGIMSTPVQTVHRDDGVFDTSDLMRETGVRRLPVVDDDGRLVGVVTFDDVLCVLAQELSNLGRGIRSEMSVR